MIINNNSIIKKNNALPKIKQNSIPNNNKTNHYKDIMNTKEMNLQSYELLEQRYKQGLISLEEFTTKCNHLQKINENK